MRKKILEVLINSKDKFISGEEISKSIGVSRTAVWKHIKKLKEEGYKIESVPKRGYMFIKEGDKLDSNLLSIDMKSKVIGKNIIHFDSIDSTSNHAKAIALKGAKEGTVVIAEEQTKGRGRLGRSWLSPKGQGIWMSIILRPDIIPTHAMKVTQIVAAAITKALRKFTKDDVLIKWPNDIVLHKKKVCGILTEMSAEIDKVNFVIVGIGVNANMDETILPKDLEDKAVSLAKYMDDNISRREIVKEILYEFEKLYMDFIESKSIHKSINICRQYSATLNNPVRIISKDGEVKARAIDLSEDGQLIVEYEDGRVEKVFSGEVSVRGLYEYV
jgi:BirA family biotin operon repressor/biotin-[acetyl-CoA-carboxylase] ligase